MNAGAGKVAGRRGGPALPLMKTGIVLPVSDRRRPDDTSDIPARQRTEAAMVTQTMILTATTTTFGPLSMAPLSPVVGAEVLDFQLTTAITDEAVAAIGAGLDQFGVLLFRDQTLDPADQVAITQRFGPLQEVAQKQYQLREHPFVYVIGNFEEDGRPIGDPSVGRLWHSDQSFIPFPAFGSLLYGVCCPDEGAETWFASMYRAYETLAEDVRARIAGLHAIHSFSEYYQALRQRDHTQPPLTDARRSQFPDVAHPLVRRNPRTGRNALYINPGYAIGIAEMPREEGSALLDALCAHACREDLLYVHRWRNGDVLFWDNLAVNHRGTPFDTERYRRRMHRTTVASDAACYRATLLPDESGGIKHAKPAA